MNEFVWFLVILICKFDSYPPTILQWMKISREREEILLDEDHRQVHRITNQQLSSTIYETQLTVIRLTMNCRSSIKIVEFYII